MLISNKHRFIFIHNPKCAGTSIYRALIPYSNYMCRYSKTQFGYYLRKLIGEKTWLSNYRYHIPAFELKELLGKKLWKSYQSFGVVRNPYDRTVSNFKYIKQTPIHHLHEAYNEYNSFEEYVRGLSKLEWQDHQNYYLSINEQIAVNYLLRFENIESDFRNLLNELNLPDIPLRKLNTSEVTSNYLDYYNPQTISIINEVYDLDFRIFGYEKITP